MNLVVEKRNNVDMQVKLLTLKSSSAKIHPTAQMSTPVP
jgi:hypothetical protein